MSAKTKKPVAKKTATKKPVATKKVVSKVEETKNEINTQENGQAVKDEVKIDGAKHLEKIMTGMTALQTDILALAKVVTANYDNLEAIEEAKELLDDAKGELGQLKFKS